MTFRSELDTVESIPESTPIDYEWLNAQIKSRYVELAQINAEIQKLTTPTVEEL